MGLIEKLGEKFKPLFDKVNGGYFGILIALIGAITIIICSILFSLSEPVGILTHWISDLGGVTTNTGLSPNGSNIVFSIGLIGLSILAIPFMIYLCNFLITGEQKFKILVFFAFLFSIGTLVGIVGVSIIDIKTDAFVHTIFATFFFIGGMAIMFMFSLAMLFNSDVSSKHALFGLICSLIPVIFLSTFAPFLLEGENIMDLVISTDASLAPSRFFEWLYLIALLAWFSEVGLYLVKKSK